MNNILRGKRANSSGRFFEQIFINYFKELEIKEVAYVFKIDEKKSLNSHKLRKRLRTDFEGRTLVYNNKKFCRAIPVYIEAKQTYKRYFPFKNIKPHQLNFLHKAYKDGCVALLVIGFIEENKIIRVEVNDEIYNYINNTLKQVYENGKLLEEFKSGINLDDLIEIVGLLNVFTYQQHDILGLSVYL